MKKIFITILSLLAIAPSLKAQTVVHPLAFGVSASSTLPNWYKNYVNMRFNVVTPASLAGEKQRTSANSGAGAATDWGGLVTSPLLNKQIVMPQAGDSLATSPITVSMTGKIALVYRGVSEFSAKALAAQTAGAIACVIVNNAAGGPVPMAVGSSGSAVTIPVFMISKADGDALDAQYCAGTIPTLTITPWGQNYANDLGFVPQGIAGWSNYATPANQLVASTGHRQYRAENGAFIANYGTHKATNVKITNSLRYTPAGGSTITIHSDVTPNLATFLPADSIYAMFNAAEYNFSPVGTGTGRFDIVYNITSDSTDQFTSDNSATYSFYTTDSIYSKGRYDFANNMPVVSSNSAPNSSTDYLWGPTYYVAHGGTAMSSVQFSLSSTAAGAMGLSSVNVYAFKWQDGAGSDLDSFAENGELTLVAQGTYNFLSTDTSGGIFKVGMYSSSTFPPVAVMLDSASWYYIAVEVPAGYFLGVDGQVSAYPRIFGRKHASNTVDYSGILWPYGGLYGGSYPLSLNPGNASAPAPYPGTYYVDMIDSFNYNSMKGMVPAVSLITNNNPLSLISGPSTICAGSTATYTDPLTGGTWSSSNPAVLSVLSATTGDVAAIAPGTAILTYSLSSSTYATMAVTVDPYPNAGTIEGPSDVCVGLSIALYNPTASPVGTFNSGGFYATVTASGVVTGLTPGTEYIGYTVTNGCGTAYAGHLVTVGPAINTGTITGSPTTICEGVSTTLYDVVPGGVWSATTGRTTVSGGVVTGVLAGVDTIKYTVSSTCGSDAAIAVVSVNAAPTPTILVSGLTLSTVVPFSAYQWLLSGAAIGGATNPTYDVTLDGPYAVTVTDANGCQGTSGVTIITTTSVNNVNAAGSSITLTPNPTTGGFSIHTANAGQLALLSVEGRTITEFAVNAGNTTLHLPAGIAPGVYMCRYTGNDGATATVRLVYKP